MIYELAVLPGLLTNAACRKYIIVRHVCNNNSIYYR